VKIVIELLSILSIATKEVKRPLASEWSERDIHPSHTLRLSFSFSELFVRKLLGKTDIEDALKRLESLIQEEVHMAIAQILKATTEVKDGTRSHRPVTSTTLSAYTLRCRQSQHSCAAGIERCPGG
jgi:hypothetical protein